MKIKFDVTTQELAIIQQVLQDSLPEQCKVWVFGSRAKNQTKYNSDLDLAIECNEALNKKSLMLLETGFDDSPLPYRVDIVDLQTVEPYFKEIIEKQKVELPLERNIPILRFPKFDDPWNSNCLSSLLTIKHGFAFKGEFFGNTGNYVVVTPGNFNPEGGFRYQGEKEKYYQSLDFPHEYILKKGDILTAMTEQAEGLIGSTIEIPESDKFLHNQRLGLFRIKETTDKSFIGYLFQKPDTRNRLSKLSAGTKVRHISPKKIESLKISYPELSEQQKIAEFLTSVDEKLNKLRRKHELMETYKRSLMQKIFSQEIRFKQDDGSDFPDWEEKKASELFCNHSNKNHKSDLPILAVTQDNGVVKRDEVDIDIKSSSASVASYKIIEPGDFVISLRSFQGGIEYSRIKGISSPAYTVLKPTLPIDDDFFRLFFKKEDFITRLAATVVGIRDGKQISYSSFSTLKLPYPALEEQRKISNMLNVIESKIANQSSKIAKLESFKKALLQKMFV